MASDDHEHDTHSHSGTNHHLSPFKRVLLLLAPEWPDLWLVVLYSVGLGLLNLAVPLASMALVNTVALGTLLQQLIVLCLALLFGLALAGVFQFLQTVVVEIIQRRIFARVALDLAHRLPRVDIRAFDRQHGPELINRFFDVLTVQKASATLLLDGITIILQTAIGLLLLGVYHQVLLSFDLVLIAALVFMIFVLGRGAVPSAIRESIAKFEVAGWMEELARHPVGVKVSGGPQFAMKNAEELTQKYLVARKLHFRRLMRQVIFALVLQAFANVALFAIGGYLVINEQLSLGQLVAAELVVTLVVASFAKLGKQLDSFYDLLAAADKLGYLTDLPLERTDGDILPRKDVGAEVTINNLHFNYDTNRPVFEHFSEVVKPGSCVAVIGRNGSGKTTLAELLFGMRQPIKGRLEIDGVDIREISLDSLRSQVALVKGPEVLEGSIRNNIIMGREGISAEDVRDALNMVGMLDEVRAFPDSLETFIRAGGAPFSQGQATRIMVARAIVGKPRLIIFDETFDDIDPETRNEVFHRIHAPKYGWTLIVITHSETTAKLCDRIINLPD